MKSYLTGVAVWAMLLVGGMATVSWANPYLAKLKCVDLHVSFTDVSKADRNIRQGQRSLNMTYVMLYL